MSIQLAWFLVRSNSTARDQQNLMGNELVSIHYSLTAFWRRFAFDFVIGVGI